MLEDYYGFTNQSAPGSQQFRRARISQRTERPPRSVSSNAKSPSPASRSLKRTQLSKQKIQGRNAGQHLRLEPPQFTCTGTFVSSEARVGLKRSQRQQIQQIGQRYDSYKLTDSYQFAYRTDGKAISRPMPPRPPPLNRQESRSRGYKQTVDSQRGGSEYYRQDRFYRSESRERSVAGSSFQRGQSGRAANRKPQESHRDVRVSRSTSRARKSKSLGMREAGFQMHTFYNIDLKKFKHYNGEGYTTARQAQLLNRVEEKALRAFYKAAVEVAEHVEKPKAKQAKPLQQERKFYVQQSSAIRHQNSRILSNLTSEHQNGDHNSPQSLQKVKNNQKVVDMSVSPKKQSQNKDSSYDDYLVGIGSRIKSSSEQDESRPQERRRISKTNNFEEDDDSLLQFKPIKAEPTPRRPSIQLVDMMGINSKVKSEGLGQIELDSMATGQLRIDTNKPGSPMIPSVSVLSDPAVNIITPKASQHQSLIGINVPDSGSLRQSKQQEKGRQQSRHFQQQSRSSLQSSKSGGATPQSSSKAQSYQQSNAVKESSELSQHNFVKYSQHQQQCSVENSSIFEEKEQSGNASAVVMTPLQSQPSINGKNRLIKRLSGISGPESSVMGGGEVVEAVQVKVVPVKESKLSDVASKSDMGVSQIMADQRTIEGREVKSPSKVSRQSNISHYSRTEYAPKQQTLSLSQSPSHLQYDLFEQLRQFLMKEEEDYSQPRRKKLEGQFLSEVLMEILRKMEGHIQIVSFIAQIILLVPQVYDFQTIYNQESQWLWQQVWLTLKRYLQERKRIVSALEGGPNCFLLLDKIIDQPFLRSQSHTPALIDLKKDLKQCNSELQQIVHRCHEFLLRFSPGLAHNPIFATTSPTIMENGLLLLSYYQEIERLLAKREEDWGRRQIKEDQSIFQSAMLLNERVFRLMEIGFALSNLSGREIKPYETEENLHEDYNQFNNYLFENKQQYKEMIRYFK